MDEQLHEFIISQTWFKELPEDQKNVIFNAFIALESNARLCLYVYRIDGKMDSAVFAKNITLDMGLAHVLMGYRINKITTQDENEILLRVDNLLKMARMRFIEMLNEEQALRKI